MNDEIDALKARIAELEVQQELSTAAIMAINQILINKGFATQDKIEDMQREMYETCILPLKEGTD